MRPLDVLQGQLQLLPGGGRIVGHLAAGFVDRVFHFAAEHLREDAPLLFHLAQQRPS